MSNERKHAELIKRWAENKDLKVEYRTKNCFSWKAVWGAPSWNPDTDYRLIEPYPYKHLKEAKVQGKKIQALDHQGYWHEVGYNPSWMLPVNSYRIKPEPKYIPFDISDAEKLIGKAVKFKDRGLWKVICSINEGVAFPIYLDRDLHISFGDLLAYYNFLDGTPCGKLVEDESN